MNISYILVFVAILFGQVPQQTEHIGCIEVDCNPRAVVNDAYENARWLCDQYYLGAPEMEIIEHNGKCCHGLSVLLKILLIKCLQNLKRVNPSK